MINDRAVDATGASSSNCAEPGAAASTVLVTDGRPAERDTVADGLARDGHRVLVSIDADAALNLLARERPDVALLHHAMVGIDGELIQHLRRQLPGLPIVIYGRCGIDADRWRHRVSIHGVGTVAIDGDDPARLSDLVSSTLLATRSVERLREECERRTGVLTQLCQTLRAPLHVIQGYADLLHDAPGTPATHAALAGLANAVANALQLTAQHVTEAGFDEAGPDVHSEPIELDTLLRELRHAAARPVRGQSVRLVARPPFSGAVLQADGHRLRVLLGHLVGCAGQEHSGRPVRLGVHSTMFGTRFELTARSARRGPRGAAPAAASAPAGDADWAIAQRLSAMLNATVTAHRTPTGTTLLALDLPTHLFRATPAGSRALLH